MDIRLLAPLLLMAACEATPIEEPRAHTTSEQIVIDRGPTLSLPTFADDLFPAGVSIAEGLEAMQMTDSLILVTNRATRAVGLISMDRETLWFHPPMSRTAMLVDAGVNGDTVGVLRLSQSEGTLHLFLSDGTLVDSLSIRRQPGTSVGNLHATASGWIVIVGRHRSDEGFLPRVEYEAHVLDRAGDHEVAAAWLDPAPSYRVGPGGNWTFGGMEAPRFAVASDPNGELLVSADSGYRVRRIDHKGARSREVTVATEATPAAHDVTEYLNYQATASGSEYRDALSAILDTLPAPEVRPAVGALWSAADGSFAVLRTDLSEPFWLGPDSLYVDVFTGDNSYCGTAGLPSNFRIVSFTGTAFLGYYQQGYSPVWQDATHEVRRTGVYRLDRSRGAC